MTSSLFIQTDKLDKKGKPVIEFQNVRVSADMIVQTMPQSGYWSAP